MWEAANAPSALARDDAQDLHHDQHTHNNNNNTKPQNPNARRIVSSETIEAALSRLSKAYTTSMECIGAIHTTNRMILKEEQTLGSTANIDSALKTIQSVSRVARTTLETAILLDPLVIPQLPTLHQCFLDLSSSSSSKDWEFVRDPKPPPPTISSAAHKSTLGKLAYLACVNYSDLLLQTSSAQSKSKTTILDRGIVPSLRIAASNETNPTQETHRLAVAALCDAVNLDATDPIAWLKLACASRRLERCSEESCSNGGWTTVERSHHRRVQRTALERGSLALAPHLPPNRTLLRALQEFHQEPEPTEYVSKTPQTTALVSTKTMELTRYSWAVLGKLILRACKGDEMTAPWETSGVVSDTSNHAMSSSSSSSSSSLFGSPTVAIQLSPMLALPSRVLGTICQFLENTSIWKFEATCKALSVTIIAARASMEDDSDHDHDDSDDDDDAADLLLLRQEERQKEQLRKIQNATPSEESEASHKANGEETKEKVLGGPKPNEATRNEEKTNEETTRNEEITSHNNDANENTAASNSSRPQPQVPPRQSSRSSQRVRSKQISTGKKQDREAKRKSFNYCFLAATLSCTKEKHNQMAEELMKGKGLDHLFRGKEDKSVVSGTANKRKKRFSEQLDSYQDSTQKSMEAMERISEASLSRFVQKWSSKNSGPMELLERYLGHVAMFAEEVFCSDSPTMGLHSCLLNSFQSLLMRSGSHSSIVPKFFRPLSETRSLYRTLELFAMDLIHAELIFRQCDRHSLKVVEFDDDANMISLMVPSLVESCNDVKADLEKNPNAEIETKFQLLQVRCYWLTASYYLWRSRIARAIYVSREAEDEGIHFIGMTINCFDSPILKSTKSVKTPHLVSPGRQDPYWREISPVSLSKFRDEIQASSVVSHARQRFQELVSNLKTTENPEEMEIDTISTHDANVLAQIGTKLFERYDCQYGSKNSKLSELIDNFLEMRGGDIVFRGTIPNGSKLKDEILIQREPYNIEELKPLSNPTILSMLVICLNMDKENRLSIAELLVRLVLSTVDMHTALLKQIADFRISRKQSNGYHSDDAMSDSDDDMSDIGPRSSQKDDEEKKARQCGHFIKFLITSLCNTLNSHLDGDEKSKLLLSNEFNDMIKSVLDFSNRWYQSTVSYLSIPNDSIDKDLVGIVQTILLESKTVKDAHTIHGKIESIFFRGLVQILVSQQEVLKDLVSSQVERSRRNARLRLCVNRAEYIGFVASKMGATLSQNLASVDNYVLTKGRLFGGHNSTEKSDHDASKPLTHEEEVMFLRSVRWLRKYAFQDDGETLNSSQANTTNSFVRPIAKELKVPISSLVIGLCGSASCSRSGDISSSGQQDSLSLTEFFDSDASMNDWKSDSEGDNKSENSKKELVRVVCHAIHCISLVFEMVDEKDTVNRFLEFDCDPDLGPLLPLVAARVLNFFADNLLIHFGEDDIDGNKRGNLWSEEYPFHTKYTGTVLDTSLYKAYRWLYGFALVGEHNPQANTGTEMAHTVNDITEIAEKGFKLENTAASGQLYRCIMRAYAGGRRTPPKHALEAVSAALPPMKESELNKSLRKFAFSGDNADLNIDSILNMRPNWDSPFQIIHDTIMHNKDSLDENGETSSEDLEAMEVRRGLSKQLALGPLPIVSVDPKTKSDAGADDDRVQTIGNEIAITKKFNAILNDLCLMDADNWEGWYRASQCCVMKADTIADRLGFTRGFSRMSNFSIPVNRGLSSRALNLKDLQNEQNMEEKMSKQLNFLGDDYSVYMNYAWSSFSSLRDCVATIKRQHTNVDDENHSTRKNITLTIWNEIDSKYDKGEFLEWQEACGGIFVKALRNLSERFMCISLYLLQSKPEINSDHKVLMSDVCETLGNIYYSELMASQSYGWPMLAMTTSRKRNLAIAAKSCYQASIKHADDSVEEDDDINDHSTWDLQFMVGKCLEKIAATFDQEEFSETETSLYKTRVYEEYMSKAISIYAKGLAEATKLEEAGNQLPDQAGGSCHGSTEMLYRLHATRLKCLIRAVSRGENEREQAELEALRLTESYFFKEAQGEGSTEPRPPKERLWKVFADIVDGLVECRNLKPFFHRSVFRHAQALMWSPVFLDPSSSKTSMDIVPLAHGSQIQGLDCSKPVAFSAEEVISTLFDKKRSQLCAVWVTNSGAASPFQAMNGTIRKYDSLRGKYIAAYLETLQLCHRRSEVETFLKWLYASKRDHPSRFKAGALNGGDKPANSHAQDPMLPMDESLLSQGFLLSCKRKANSVLAGILMHQLSSLPSGQASKPSIDGMKFSEVYLKNAYACYLRLNSSIQDLKKLRAFKYGSDSILEVDALCQAYLALGEDATSSNSGTNNFGDWSGGGRKLAIFEQALLKCKSLFPTLSATNFFGKSKSKKAKSNQTNAGPDPDDNGRKSSKRKAGDSDDDTNEISNSNSTKKKVSFEVAVPSGLKTGDTFLTSVKVGDSQPIKVKLTVPKGNHSTLRFNLNVPDRKSNKKARVSSS